jgi:hypothetical protein
MIHNPTKKREEKCLIPEVLGLIPHSPPDQNTITAIIQYVSNNNGDYSQTEKHNDFGNSSA